MHGPFSKILEAWPSAPPPGSTPLCTHAYYLIPRGQLTSDHRHYLSAS